MHPKPLRFVSFGLERFHARSPQLIIAGDELEKQAVS
jgi:hypothetical protein